MVENSTSTARKGVEHRPIELRAMRASDASMHRTRAGWRRCVRARGDTVMYVHVMTFVSKDIPSYWE